MWQPAFVSIDAGLLLHPIPEKRVWDALNRIDTLTPVLAVAHSVDEQKIASLLLGKRLTGPTVMVYDRAKEAAALLGAVDQSSRDGLAGKITAGKRLLHLGIRKSSFIDRFTPPGGGTVCHPFYKIVWGSECPFDCSYCFLQLTYRMFPYMRQYLNWEEMFRDIDRIAADGIPKILNAGELADVLAMDHITHIVPAVLAYIQRYPHIKVMMLTKSDQVDHLPDIANQQGIVAASLTTPYNASIFEAGTAHPYERIKALRIAQGKGYAVRVRLDPIITASPTWEDEYLELLTHLFRAVEPEMITLGQLRFYPMLLRIIQQRHPEAGAYYADLARSQTGEHRARAEAADRTRVYKIIKQAIADVGRTSAPHIALCKEEALVVRETAVDMRRCNCLG